MMTKIEVKEIPYVNLVAQHAPLKEELLRAAAAVIDRGDFILGREVTEFENRFAQICGTRFAVAVNSGTDALILALKVLGIGPGDEVITPPNSFVATASSICLVRARPVFVDVEDDLNIDAGKIEKAITKKTKAILPVHLTGRPAQVKAIREIANKNNLFVIEDAAQAVLAKFDRVPVGAWGDMGCFSLHPLKTLNALGDGGVLTINNEDYYRRLLTLRNLGLVSRDKCQEWSNNSRLDTLQAAFLLVKLNHLEAWTAQRRAHAALYRKLLSPISELRVPGERPGEFAVYHTFVIQAESRDELKKFLEERGIKTAIHYPIPIHLQQAGAHLGYREGDFPVAEAQAKKILSLPVYPELELSNIEFIAKTIEDFYGGAK